MTKISSISIPANRFKIMLQMIPRAPESISTERIQEKLAIAGFDVNLRTVQRNLKDLVDSGEFGLASNKRGRDSTCWQYTSDAAITIFPSMDEHTALAFGLADAFLKTLMPSETVRALKPFVEEAGRYLSKPGQAGVGKWKKKILVFSHGMRRKAPNVRPEVREVVYRALLQEKSLRLIHLSRRKREPSEFIISPIGLVVRDYLIYLYGLTREKKQVLAFALNRTQRAEILENEVFDKSAASINLADYEDLVNMPIKGSGRIELKLRLGPNTTYSLRECPIVGSKSLVDDPDNHGGGILSLDAPNTVELRQWIRSLGPNAEVLEPSHLRHEMAEEVATLAKRYGSIL